MHVCSTLIFTSGSTVDKLSFHLHFTRQDHGLDPEFYHIYKFTKGYGFDHLLFGISLDNLITTAQLITHLSRLNPLGDFNITTYDLRPIQRIQRISAIWLFLATIDSS